MQRSQDGRMFVSAPLLTSLPKMLDECCVAAAGVIVMPATLIAVYFSPSLPLGALHEAHIETCLISGTLFVMLKTDT